MNNDMKCPVCNKQMKIGTLDLDDSMGTVWMSIMPCDCVCSYGASKAVWQELIRTRKALDKAKSKLNGIHRLYSKAFYTREDWLQVCMEMVDKANTALEQITNKQNKRM